jgi:hypothetical protein
MKKEKFIFDTQRCVWVGQFHELQKSGTSHPPRVMLGTSEECEYKATKRGLVRRSESELIKWLSVLYDKKRQITNQGKKRKKGWLRQSRKIAPRSKSSCKTGWMRRFSPRQSRAL